MNYSPNNTMPHAAHHTASQLRRPQS